MSDRSPTHSSEVGQVFLSRLLGSQSG